MTKQLYLTVKQHYFIKYNCGPLPYLRFWMTTPQLPKGLNPPLQTRVGLRSL